MNRKVMASLLVIGVVGAAAGGSTFALFHETETTSNNTFEAGTLDLQIDWEEYYNGELVEEQELTSDPEAIFDLNDVKPGDHGVAQVSLHLFDNPGYVWMDATQTAGDGNDLEENLYFTIWRDADSDSEIDEGEEIYFEGTAAELDETEMSEFLIDGQPEQDGVQPLPNSTTEHVGIEWHVPIETGNEIQEDVKEFEFSFYTEQARHNDISEGDGPTQPGLENDTDDDTGDETEYEPTNWQIDLATGEVIDDLTNETYHNRSDMERYAHGQTTEEGPVLSDDRDDPSIPFCIKSSSEFEVSGNATHPEADVSVEIRDYKWCNNVDVTLASYENTGELGWSGGENQELYDFLTIELDRGESEDLNVELPPAEELE